MAAGFPKSKSSFFHIFLERSKIIFNSAMSTITVQYFFRNHDLVERSQARSVETSMVGYREEALCW